jgi:phospholipase C
VGDSPGKRNRRKQIAIASGAVAAAAALTAAIVTSTGSADAQSIALKGADSPLWHQPHQTTTPIKHVVVLFDENISFDHYFGTYPNAANTDGTTFVAKKNTPRVDGLTPALLTKNPNLYNPTRLTPAQAVTCDQNHGYTAEQKAYDGGKMDQFVQFTNKDSCSPLYGRPGLVMDYYDGNTVTGLWNYAQNYAMSDNSYNTVFGPSTPGALNLISGQTHGAYAVNYKTGEKTTDTYTAVGLDSKGVGTVINDPDPYYDDCSDINHTATNNLAVLNGKNVGDLLNAKGVTWGWFQGGFRPTTPAAESSTGYAVCGASHANVGGATVVDYSPHHSPFEYYKSTSNPHHLPPSKVSKIGYTDQANHNYDLTDFDAALKGGSLPSVSYLKAPEYQDGHAGYSDPLDEQTFLASYINKIQQSKYWKDTAVVVAYDDSDGWYDHKKGPVVNGSTDATYDQAAVCGSTPASGGYLDRCGYGPRTPLLIISPYSKVNHVDHAVTDQTSVLKFVEDNWRLGRIGDSSFDAKAGSLTGMFNFWGWARAPRVLLNPSTGAVTSP